MWCQLRVLFGRSLLCELLFNYPLMFIFRLTIFIGCYRINTYHSHRLLIWNFTFDWSVGPVAYAIFCEVSATRVRSKTIAVATAVQALVGIVMTVAIPYLINPDQANLRGKLGFFFGGLSLPCLLWCWLR
jgi:hypothetical protein